MNILSVHGRVWLFVCVLLSLFTNRTDADIVCNTVAGATVVDFAFAIDTSGSMCPYIEQLTDSLAYFALKLQNLNVDARFAVIAFGGKPQILLPFTADSKLTASTLRNIDCTGGGQEASLEAIRALLAPNYGADFLKSCEYYKQKNGKSGDDYCNIIWRTNAKKNIILITDEDSDLPTLRNYRVRNQTSSNALCANRYSFSSGTPYCSSSSANFEPNWEPKAYWSRYNTFFRTDKGMVIDPAYQYEIDLTASLVVASDVSINMLINSGVNPATSNPQSYYDSRNLYWIATKSKTTPNYKDSLQTTVVQFGDPSLTATDDTLLKFDSALTLKYLIANGLGKSLQGRVLAAGGFLRLFEINDLLKTTVSSNGNTFTQNFYNATANSVTTCITIPGTNPHSDLPPPILTDIAPVPSSLLTTTTTKTTATTTTTKTTSTTSTTPTKTTSSTTTTSTTTTPTTTTTSTSSTTTSTSTSTTTTSTATSTTTSTSTSTTTTSTTITTSTSTTSTTSTATTSTTSTTTTDTTSTTSTTTTDTTSTTSTTSTATTSTTSTTSTDTTSTTSTMTASAASTPTQITASTPSTNVGLVSAATTTPFTSEKTSTTTTTTTSTTSTETTTTTRTTSTTTDSTTTSSTTTDTTTTSSTTTTDTTTTTSDTTTTTTTDTTTTTTTSTTTTDTTTTTTTSTTTTDSTTTTSTTTTTTTDTTTTTTTDTTTTTTTTDSTTTSDTTTTTSTTTSDTPTSTTTTTFTPVIIPNVFCGGGVVGNGTCLISGQCCSQYGYCDVGLDYCGTTDASEEYIDPQDEGMANSTIPGSDTCGYGVIGNGICDDSLLECSKWGWCMPAEVTGTPKPAPTYDPNGVIEGTETPQPNTDSGTEEKSTLSNTALAGGVGAGVLCLGAAASLFVLRRNRSSQMVSLFSVGSGDVFGNQVADNPLYRKEGNYVENPLFKVANEPVKGTAETADNV